MAFFKTKYATVTQSTNNANTNVVGTYNEHKKATANTIIITNRGTRSNTR